MMIRRRSRWLRAWAFTNRSRSSRHTLSAVVDWEREKPIKRRKDRADETISTKYFVWLRTPLTASSVRETLSRRDSGHRQVVVFHKQFETRHFLAYSVVRLMSVQIQKFLKYFKRSLTERLWYEPYLFRQHGTWWQSCQSSIKRSRSAFLQRKTCIRSRLLYSPNSPSRNNYREE